MTPSTIPHQLKNLQRLQWHGRAQKNPDSRVLNEQPANVSTPPSRLAETSKFSDFFKVSSVLVCFDSVDESRPVRLAIECARKMPCAVHRRKQYTVANQNYFAWRTP